LTWLILLVLITLALARRRGGPVDLSVTEGPDAPLAAPPVERLRKASLARLAVLVLALGLADVSGLVFFSAGLEVAPAWLIGLLASVGPVVAIAAGLVVFRERLRRAQWLGIGLVAVALVLVAVGEAAAPGGG
jgi:EamA domain-containing membrane protein RarD